MTDLPLTDTATPSRRTNAVTALRAARASLAATITPAGWFVLAATLLSAWLAVTMGLVEFAVIAVFGVVSILIALPFVLGRPHTQVALRLERTRVTVGSGARILATVSNDAARPALGGRVELAMGEELIQLDYPALAAHGETQVGALLETPRRGVFQIGPATILRTDPLGLFRRSRTDRQVHTLFVHPRTVPVPPASIGLIRDLDGNPTATIVDADIAFHAIRPYMPGDAQRHIHWKSTAKTGTLMVKQFEETRRSRLTVLLATNTAEFASETESELGISVAASLAQESIREGRETELIVSPSGSDAALRRSRAVRSLPTPTPYALLDALSALELSSDTVTIDHVGARAAMSRRNASLVVVVTGSTAQLQSLRRAVEPFGPDVQAVAVLCDPASEPSVRRIGSLLLLRVGVLSDLQQLVMRGALS